MNFSNIQLNDDHEESREYVKILDDLNGTSIEVQATKEVVHNNTMLLPEKQTIKHAKGDDTMAPIKRLRFESKEPSVDSMRARRVIRDRRSNSNRKYDSSSSSSNSRSRKKKTRSRTNRISSYDKDYENDRIYDDYNYKTGQIIILNIPIKFDRDMEFNKHLYYLFNEIRIMNFSHDQYRQGYMIGRLIDEPDRIKIFYELFKVNMSYFRNYRFVFRKFEKSSGTPMMRFSYKVVKFGEEIITLD
jgi:hypothetical protein